MSAANTIERSSYRIVRAPFLGYALVDVSLGCGEYVDRFRTRAGAEYWRDMLDAGRARVNPHATVGCRVEIC